MDILNKLEEIKRRWEDVGEKLTQPDLVQDMKKFTSLNKEYSELDEIVKEYEKYKNLLSNIENNKSIISEEKDEEMRELAKADLDELEAERGPMESRIRNMLVPKEPEDSKNAIMELRAGTGGDEASLFVGDLFRMYQKFCENQGWRTEVIDVNEGTAGGFKEIIFNVYGTNVYGQLKYESGVHRVQRVPATETQGRVHTSAASVVVLPEAEAFDVDIKENDIRKDTFCSSGPGGQSVNTTYSAIRLTHIPTGIVAQCQDEKSQIKNYEKALKVLRSRIFEIEYQKRMDEVGKKRKTMVSTGDRSAKIRTYNYPQGRVTDHRIGLTLYNLDGVLSGEVQPFIEALQLAENAEKLKEGSLFEA
jgi:peptide chain release factor 1